MSQDEPLGRKEKKAQRDAERKKSGKKRKHEEVEKSEDAKAPAEELKEDFIPLGGETKESSGEKTKTPRPSKKRKAQEAVAEPEDAPEKAPDTTAPKPKRRKKQKTATAQNGADAPTTPAEDGKAKHRFVCFIGNLPYDTTDTTLQGHFKKLLPFTLRHRTDPATKRSKGFAFLEFENYDRMKTCLKLYHHSMFDPATALKADGEIEVAEEDLKRVKGKMKGARRINVELTAGGGGSKDVRKEKIKVKNVRLDEQRQRRADAEREAKVKEEGKKAMGGKGVVGKKPPRVSGGGDGAAAMADPGMHPSRLAMIKN